jgi:hypothetical protein
MPATLVYLFIGAAGRDALGSGSIARWSLLAAGLAATLAATWLVGRAARKRLGLDK